MHRRGCFVHSFKPNLYFLIPCCKHRSYITCLLSCYDRKKTQILTNRLSWQLIPVSFNVIEALSIYNLHFSLIYRFLSKFICEGLCFKCICYSTASYRGPFLIKKNFTIKLIIVYFIENHISLKSSLFSKSLYSKHRVVKVPYMFLEKYLNEFVSF